jgi:ABC-type nitrate/sulfonate/bicarbonate transport system permease component
MNNAINNITNYKYFKKLIVAFPALVATLLFLIIWESYIESNDIPKRILPKPSDILDYILNIKNFSLLLNKTLESFFDAFIGFSISVLLGTIIGILFAKKKYTYVIFLPLLFIIQLLPIPAFAPVIAAIFKYGIATKIIIVVLFTIFPVIISVYKAVINIPGRYKALFISYNANFRQTLTNIILPSIVPNLFVTLKIISTASFVGSIIAELPLATSSGIGKDIYNSFNNQLIYRVWSSLLIISVISLLFFLIISYLEKFILKKFRYGIY